MQGWVEAQPANSSSGGHGILLSIRKQNSTFFIAICNLLHQRRARRNHCAQCHGTKSSTECGYVAHYSIDGLSPPHLRATLTTNAPLLQDAPIGKRASRPWDCCLTNYKSKVSNGSHMPPFWYMVPNLIVPSNPKTSNSVHWRKSALDRRGHPHIIWAQHDKSNR